MELKELVPHLLTIGGVIFGFGWQSANMKQNARDIKNIGQSHREILEKLQTINIVVARIDQRLTHVEKDQ